MVDLFSISVPFILVVSTFIWSNKSISGEVNLAIRPINAITASWFLVLDKIYSRRINLGKVFSAVIFCLCLLIYFFKEKIYTGWIEEKLYLLRSIAVLFNFVSNKLIGKLEYLKEISVARLWKNGEASFSVGFMWPHSVVNWIHFYLQKEPCGKFLIPSTLILDRVFWYLLRAVCTRSLLILWVLTKGTLAPPVLFAYPGFLNGDELAFLKIFQALWDQQLLWGFSVPQNICVLASTDLRPCC